MLNPRDNDARLLLTAIFLFVVFWSFALTGQLPDPSRYQHETSTGDGAQRKPDTISAEDRLADYTAGLMYFTAILAIVSAVQIFFLTKADNNTRESIRLAAGDAERRSSETEIIQRAYISVEPMGLHHYTGSSTEHHVIAAHYGIRNAGRLPAQKIRWFAYIEQDEDKDAKKRRNFPINEADLYGDNVIAAGAAMRQGVGDPFTLKATGFIYVWGIVRYDDGFGNKRFTKFCHRYNRAILRNIEGEGYGIQAELGREHGHGNSTDDSEPG